MPASLSNAQRTTVNEISLQCWSNLAGRVLQADTGRGYRVGHENGEPRSREDLREPSSTNPLVGPVFGHRSSLSPRAHPNPSRPAHAPSVHGQGGAVGPRHRVGDQGAVQSAEQRQGALPPRQGALAAGLSGPCRGGPGRRCQGQSVRFVRGLRVYAWIVRTLTCGRIPVAPSRAAPRPPLRCSGGQQTSTSAPSWRTSVRGSSRLRPSHARPWSASSARPH